MVVTGVPPVAGMVTPCMAAILTTVLFGGPDGFVHPAKADIITAKMTVS
jgi:hypothetical protein